MTGVLLTKHYVQPQQIRMLCWIPEPVTINAHRITDIYVVNIAHILQCLLPPKSCWKDITVQEDVLRSNELIRAQIAQIGEECERHSSAEVDVVDKVGNDVFRGVCLPAFAFGVTPLREQFRGLATQYPDHVEKVWLGARSGWLSLGTFASKVSGHVRETFKRTRGKRFWCSL